MSQAEPHDRGLSKSHHVRASVILRSHSGKSVKHPDTRITPENVKSYLPSQDALQQVAVELRKLGFAIELIAPTHLSISGEPTLFEQAFHAKLAEKEYPAFGEQLSGPRQVRFESDRPLTIPKVLSKLVESIDLEPAVTLFTSATPPAIPYDHMELPDDVARGMDAIKAHERGITGQGIDLAMVDTGFMTPVHPYYASRGYTINPVSTYPGDTTPGDDSYGHGTAISACALAVAPGVTYTVYKFDISGSHGPGGSLTAAFSRAAMAGPHIITMSLGVFNTLDTALQLAINNAVADGVAVLLAVGNGVAVGWPASEPAVISVGGVFLAKDDSVTASNFSSSGTNSNNPGRQCPDVCGLNGIAPHGVYIAAPTQPSSNVDTAFAGGTFPNKDETAANDGWVVASGTSASTPMVAGVCALMMQSNPSLRGNPSQLRTALVNSCMDVTTGSSASGESAGAGNDKATGAGLVQAYRAVHATDLWMRDNPDSDIGLVPTTGRRPAYPPYTHWTSPDIKVVAATLANPQADFDGAAEVEPIFNQDNYVYLRVRNRGTQNAANVATRLFYADPSTSLSFPSDWKDGSSGIPSNGSLSVGGATSNLQTLSSVPANGFTVTPLPFVWRPPDPTTATQSQTLPDGRVVGHFCLLSRLTSGDDPIIFPVGNESSVIDDNNISMKNEHVYSGPATGGHPFKFFVRGDRQLEAPRKFVFAADIAHLPDGTEIELDVPQKDLRCSYNVTARNTAETKKQLCFGWVTESWQGRKLILASLDLKPAEQTLAKITMYFPTGTRQGLYPLSIAQAEGGRLVGGVTLVSRVT